MFERGSRREGTDQVIRHLAWSGLFAFCVGFALLSVSAPIASAGPPRGTAGDLWADVILGQARFSEITGASSRHLNMPFSVIVDRASPDDQKLYVYDAGANRVLGFDLEDCYQEVNCSPQVVLGQPDLMHSGCNGDSNFQGFPQRAPAGAGTLCGMPEWQISPSEGGSGSSMAVDAQRSLYVTDAWNHRLLKYEDPFAPGEDPQADDVWGQDDFFGNECNRGMSTPGAASLCSDPILDTPWSSGVDVDSSGNIWVADRSNRRILRFPPGQPAGAKQADLVLGQPDFNTRGPACSPSRLSGPAALRVLAVDGGYRVYVADYTCNRVMVYEPDENGNFANGQPGREFGGPGADFHLPSGIDPDPTRPGHVWIPKPRRGAGRLELWRLSDETMVESLAFSSGVLGSIGIDEQGSLLVVQRQGRSVLRFEKTLQGGEIRYRRAPDLLPASQEDPVFGAADLSRQLQQTLAVYDGSQDQQDQLIVNDGDKLLFWNNDGTGALADTLANNEPADGCVIVLPPEPSCTLARNDASGLEVVTLKADGGDPARLWVHRRDRILVYDLPLSPGEVPIKTIRYPIPLLGGGEIGASDPSFGIAPTENSRFLWVSQRDTNRVFRIRNPLSDTERVVDVVLGRSSCRRTSAALCKPGALSFDRFGNLFVSDHALEVEGNMRLLVFDGDLFPTRDPLNSSLIARPPATKVFPDQATFEPAFDSANRMVVGYNPYFGVPNPQLFPDSVFPLSGSGGVSFPGVYATPLSISTAPGAFLRDFQSMPMSAAFDDDDNLYVLDHNRGRVLAYRQPLLGMPAGGESPVIEPLGDQNVSELSLLTLPVVSDAPSGGAATLKADGLPAGASFVDHGDGTGTFSWTPGSVQAGTYRALFTLVTDNGFDVEPVTITVTNVNDPPALRVLDPDVNDDGGVEMSDILQVAGSFGRIDDQSSDLDGDGTVSLVGDILLDASSFGLRWPPVVREGMLLRFFVKGIDPDGDTLTFPKPWVASLTPPYPDVTLESLGATYSNPDEGTADYRREFRWRVPVGQAREVHYAVRFSVDDPWAGSGEFVEIRVVP